jgi:hypothetical protein
MPHIVWVNVSNRTLMLQLPGEIITLAPGEAMGLSCAALAEAPMAEAILEGAELRGELRRVGFCPPEAS